MKNNKTICFYDLESTCVTRDADPISVGLVAVTTTNKNYEDYLLAPVDKRSISFKEWRKENTQQTVKTFYAEFTDFNPDKADDWVKENIIDKLCLEYQLDKFAIEGDTYLKNNNTLCLGTSGYISKELKHWLSQFEEVKFWADFDVIDKPMLIDLITDWSYSKPCGFISSNSTHYEENLRAYVCDRCGDSKSEDCTFKVGLPKHLPNIQYYDFYDLHTLFKIKGVDPDISREDYVVGELHDVIKDEIIWKLDDDTSGKHNALWDAVVNWKCYEKLNSLNN